MSKAKECPVANWPVDCLSDVCCRGGGAGGAGGGGGGCVAISIPMSGQPASQADRLALEGSLLIYAADSAKTRTQTRAQTRTPSRSRSRCLDLLP